MIRVEGGRNLPRSLKHLLDAQQQVFQPMELDDFFRVSPKACRKEGVTQYPAEAHSLFSFCAGKFPIDHGIDDPSQSNATQCQHMPDRS